jgi:hypothetical protein
MILEQNNESSAGDRRILLSDHEYKAKNDASLFDEYTIKLL